MESIVLKLIIILAFIDSAIANDAFLSNLNKNISKISKLKNTDKTEANNQRQKEQRRLSFYKSLEGKLSKAEIDMIKQEFSAIDRKSSSETHKEYVKKISNSPSKKSFSQSEIDSMALLIKAFDKKLKSIPLLARPASVLAKTDNSKNMTAPVKKSHLSSSRPAIILDSTNIKNDKDEHAETINDAIVARDQNNSKYATKEEDGLFDKITKTYIRNYHKLNQKNKIDESK